MPYSYDPEAAGLIPEGVHILTITSVEESTSRKGDPMWIVRLEDDQRREVTEWIVLTPNIVDWKLRPLWQASGLQWPDTNAILDERELVDRQVQATISHERSSEFGTQARVQGYTRVGEGSISPQEAFDMTDMQPPAPVGGPHSGADDDIPF
jgi:hypothetical protein